MKYLSILFLSLQLGCAGASTTPMTQRPVLIAVGDSITYGVPSTLPDGYVESLGMLLNMGSVNFSIPGTRLESYNQYQLITTTTFKSSDILFFLPGRNDINKYGKDSVYLNQYSKQLTEVFDHIEALGSTMFALTTLNLRDNNNPALDLAGVYSDVMKNTYAKKQYNHVYLIDTNRLFIPTHDLMNDDTHPNHKGQIVLSQLVYAEYVRLYVKR